MGASKRSRDPGHHHHDERHHPHQQHEQQQQERDYYQCVERPGQSTLQFDRSVLIKRIKVSEGSYGFNPFRSVQQQQQQQQSSTADMTMDEHAMEGVQLHHHQLQQQQLQPQQQQQQSYKKVWVCDRCGSTTFRRDPNGGGCDHEEQSLQFVA